MRDYRELQEKFLTECKAHLNERADARMAEIATFESRCALLRRAHEEAYIEMIKQSMKNPTKSMTLLNALCKSNLRTKRSNRPNPLGCRSDCAKELATRPVGK
jgi:hypothetical protein